MTWSSTKTNETRMNSHCADDDDNCWFFFTWFFSLFGTGHCPVDQMMKWIWWQSACLQTILWHIIICMHGQKPRIMKKWIWWQYTCCCPCGHIYRHIYAQLHICHRWMRKWHVNMITKWWQFSPVYRQCEEGCSPCGQSGFAPGLSPCRQVRSSAKSQISVLTPFRFRKEKGGQVYC